MIHLKIIITYFLIFNNFYLNLTRVFLSLNFTHNKYNIIHSYREREKEQLVEQAFKRKKKCIKKKTLVVFAAA